MLSNIIPTNNLIMAVEKSKVIARLKALYPKANLSQKRLDALADKLAKKPADDADDVAIDLVINDFNEIMSITEIAAEDDRVRTIEAKSKETSDPPKNDPPKTDPPKGEVPEWAQAMAETNRKLLEKVEAIESGKVLETKKQSAQTVFETSEVFKNASKEVKDFMLKNIDVNSETPIEDQVKGLEDTFGKMVQNSADTNNYSGPAGAGNPAPKYDEKEIERLVSEI